MSRVTENLGLSIELSRFVAAAKAQSALVFIVGFRVLGLRLRV